MSERVDTLSRALVTRREARDKAKQEYERLKADYREVEQAIWDHMDDQGMTTMTLDLGTGFGKVQFQRRETIRGRSARGSAPGASGRRRSASTFATGSRPGSRSRRAWTSTQHATSRSAASRPRERDPRDTMGVKRDK